MSFKTFLQDFDKEYQDYVLEDAKKQIESMSGRRKISDGKNTLYTFSGWDEKTLHLFTNYRTEKTTKRLVWATWALAIGTLLLSGVTIYLQYFKN